MGGPSGLAAVFNMSGGTGGDEDRLGDTLGAIPSDVARHFAAAGGVSHHGDVRDIECADHGCEIVGVPVHVVSRPGLTRSTVATTIVCHHPEAVLRE